MKNIYLNAVARTVAFACLLEFLTSWVPFLHAQTNYSSVRGLVTDSQGAAIVNAKVTLTSERNHEERSEITNGSGLYIFVSVDPGSYTVSVNQPGFKTIRETGIATELGVTTTVDLKLAIGEQQQNVTVSSGETELIDTASASNGQLYDQRKLEDLPNPGRNPFLVGKYDNNVLPLGNPQQPRAEDQNQTSSFSLAGAPIGTNGYVVDGIPTGTSSGIVTFIPSIEAVSELKVQANTFDAEVGRVGGGVFNASLKSGGSTLHGVLYGITRQTSWAANNFYSNLAGTARPVQNVYQWSGGLGGPLPLDRIPGFNKVPLIRGKYFFWIVEDGYRWQAPYSGASSKVFVPTPAERAGDFTAADSAGYLNGAVEPTLYDPTQPFTGGVRTAKLTGILNGVPTPNVVPSSYVNPIAQYILNQYPVPNVTPSATSYGSGQYWLPSDSVKTRADMYSGKVDHQFTSKWSAAASYVHLATQEPGGNSLHVYPEPAGILTRYIDATAVNNTILITPTTVLNVSYGFNRYWSATPTYSSGFNQANGFGGIGLPAGFVSQLQSKSFPSVSLSPATSLGSSNSGPTINYSRNFVVAVSKTLGKQTLKAGYVYRGLRVYAQSFSGGNGSYSSNGQFTSVNGSASTVTSGNGIADFLIGGISSASLTINTPYTLQLANYNAFYGQDDVRLTPKLTLNLGLRFEIEPGQSEKNNKFIVGFDPTAKNPLPTTGPQLNGGVEFAGQNGYPTRTENFGTAKYSPRVGFAYAIREKTVLRAGFGLFYAPVALVNSDPGYTQATNYTTSNLTTPVSVSTLASGSFLSNPFPGGLLQPSGNTLGYLTGVGGSISAQDRNRKYPFVQQYSFDLQHELPGRIALKLGYVGAHTRNYQNTLNINQVPNSVLFGATGNSLAKLVANPFYAATVGGYPSTGLAAQKTVPAAQLLLPFPQFSSVTLTESNGESRYNSLIVKVQRNFRNGLTLLATYTWASNWDNIYSSLNGPASTDNLNGTNGPQDGTNPKAEYARAANDIPNRFALVITYDLPFGRGRTYLSNINRWLNAAIGGWTINDQTAIQNGGPLSFTQTDLNTSSAFGTTGVGGSVQRPNLIPGVKIAQSGRPQSRLGGINGTQTYFNTAAFVAAPAYTYGNAPRTLPVYGPGSNNSDLSIHKSFPIGDRFKFQFRAEALNAFNTPQFAAPSTSLPVNTSTQTITPGTTFGQISSQVNYSRIIQLGGRINF